MLSPTRWSQPSRRVLRSAVTVLAAVTCCTVTGCAVGFDAQTTQFYTAPEGTDVRGGDVEGLNMLVVDNGDGTGTLVAALVNNNSDDDDTLTKITALDPDDDEAQVKVSGADKPLPLPAGGLVQLADTGQVVLTGDPVFAGQVLSLTLTFERAGAITAEVPVVPRDERYEDVPTPAPTPVPDETPETVAPAD